MQQPIFVDDRKRMDVTFQNAVEKCSETGLVAVKTGADVCDDFRATGCLEMLGLTKQIFFLIVGRDAGRCLRSTPLATGFNCRSDRR